MSCITGKKYPVQGLRVVPVTIRKDQALCLQMMMENQVKSGVNLAGSLRVLPSNFIKLFRVKMLIAKSPFLLAVHREFEVSTQKRSIKYLYLLL